MRNFYKIIPMIFLALAMGIAGCSKDDEPGGDDGNSTDSGNYGTLGGNLITIGSTRDVTYTSSVLLGTVDFPKITGDHTYGIVYMEQLKDPEFDYDGKLVYGGHSNKTDKEYYDCITAQITSSAADGKFEKQLVGLKPATRYYYRAYVAIGQNVNYSKVEYFTTQDPAPEITLATGDPTDIFAVASTMNGVCNVGNLQDVNEDQEYGFIFTDAPQLSTPDKLTYEYYEEWENNHYETEDYIEEPDEVTTKENLNGRISCKVDYLKPGKTYYYRTFFMWNDKYFYSAEVKSLTTKGPNEITVGTNKATDVTSSSATLNASFPFSLIGENYVPAGFLISKKYSNASEFKIENAIDWDDRYRYPDADVYRIGDEISDKNFSMTINGLNPETTYYVCAFVNLYEGDDEKEDPDIILYGSMQSFMTEKAGFSDEAIEVFSTGSYPWENDSEDGEWWSSNAGIDNSTSVLSIRVSHKAGQSLRFYLEVSSESGCDGAIIDVDGVQQMDFISGSFSKYVTIPFKNSGISVVKITYKKDGSTSRGGDSAYVRDIQLQ